MQYAKSWLMVIFDKFDRNQCFLRKNFFQKMLFQGKYLSFNFDQSVRLRINHVRGKNAVLSGIFFD